MTRRVPLDDEQEFALWRTVAGKGASHRRRVLIAHQDRMICQSLSLLISIKGFETAQAATIDEVRRIIRFWKPDALMLDTRLDSASRYGFVRRFRADYPSASLLILAMSNIWPLDSIGDLRSAGFDGHVRRPCSLWRIVELITRS